MSHSIANLEHYHFRYPMHRRPGDLHAYFFGAAVMSYASGVQTAPGDEYEIQAQAFGKPLRNRMESVPDEGLVDRHPAVTAKVRKTAVHQNDNGRSKMGLKKLFLRLATIGLAHRPDDLGRAWPQTCASWPGTAMPTRTGSRNSPPRPASTSMSSSSAATTRSGPRSRAAKGKDFDVFAVNTAQLQRYIDAELVTPIDLAKLPNQKEVLPRFRDLDRGQRRHQDGKVYGIPFCFDSIGLIYDTDKVKPAPTSMSVLWDPEYKGKVLAYDNGEHNFSFTALTLGYQGSVPPRRRADGGGQGQAGRPEAATC